MIADTQLDPAAVELGNFYRRPPAVVWRALTEPDLLQRWLLRPTPFTATAGARFRFTAPGAALDQVACEVLVADPYEQLTYSWVYSQATYPVSWIVGWTLQPQGSGTRLLLRQTGFDIEDRRQRMVRNAVERSWKRCVLPRLGAALDHGGPPLA
ncbi:SRPBCC family protein [Nocardia brasiliensis]|uniref:SRPBCC family protein n=1 Tax=Nocardia brasiliensis TaxID=37326 RepID=UPI002453DCA8|nr:SRPBCC domain-containing protein [Nocardia brasiliensis]